MELNLGILDYDHVLKKEPLAPLHANSPKDAKEKYNKWHKHNKIALIMIKKSILDNVKRSILDSNLAKVYLNSISEKSKVSNKAEMGKLMKTFMSMEFDGKGNVGEYIIKGYDIIGKLKDLNMTVEEPFLVYMLLNSLPNEYDHLKTLYKTQKESWTVNELTSLCVEVEEERKKCSSSNEHGDETQVEKEIHQ